MSDENLELARQGYEAYERAGVDGIIPFLDEEIEWRNPPDSSVAGVFFGHEGVREWHRQTHEVWEEIHFEQDRIDELPDERLLAIVRARVKSRGSGIEIEAPFAHVIKFRAGKIIALSMYASVDMALKAVGIEEQPMSAHCHRHRTER